MTSRPHSDLLHPPRPWWVRRPYLYFGATVLIAALSSYSQVLSVFRDQLQDYLNIGLKKYGLLMSAGAIPGAIGALGAGVLVHRAHPRAVIRAALVGGAVGLGLFAWRGPSYQRLILATVIVAASGQALFISIQSHVVELFPQQRRRALSVYLVALSAVGMFYPLWAEFLLERSQNDPAVDFGSVLHWPFGVVAILVVAGSFLYRQGKAQSPSSDPHSAGAAGEAAPRWSELWPLVGMLVLHGTVDTACWTWMPRVLDSPSFTEMPYLPGHVMAAFGLAYVVSRGALALMPDHVARRTMLVLPGICGGGLMLAGVLSRDYTLTAAGYVGGALLWSFEMPAITAEISRRAGRRFGLVISVGSLVGGVGVFVLTNAMAWLGDALPPEQLWRILLLPAAGFPCVGIGGAIWLWRHRRARTVIETPREGETDR